MAQLAVVYLAVVPWRTSPKQDIASYLLSYSSHQYDVRDGADSAVKSFDFDHLHKVLDDLRLPKPAASHTDPDLPLPRQLPRQLPSQQDFVKCESRNICRADYLAKVERVQRRSETFSAVFDRAAHADRKY